MASRKDGIKTSRITFAARNDFCDHSPSNGRVLQR
jgi:hypothetical protein